MSSARRSERSSSGRPRSSAKRKTSARLCSCVSFASRILASSCGPKSVTVARTGTPGPIPPSERTRPGRRRLVRETQIGHPLGCRPVGAPGRPGRRGRLSRRRRRPAPRLRTAARRSPGSSSSCRFRLRRRRGRGGSSSRAASGRPRPARPRLRGRRGRDRSSRPRPRRLSRSSRRSRASGDG